MRRIIKIAFISILAFLVIFSGVIVFYFVPIGESPIIPQKEDGGYPRLANRLMTTWITSKKARELVKWDLIIVPCEVRTPVGLGSPLTLSWMREQNPDIKILGSIQLGSIPPGPVPFFTFGDIYKNGDESWWLHYPDDPENPKPLKERRVSLFGTAVLPNPVSEWSSFMLNYVRNAIVSSGLFDGIWFDVVRTGKQIVDFAGDRGIDIDNDGFVDDPCDVIRLWDESMATFLKGISSSLGPDRIVICNGWWDNESQYWDCVNGNYHENALGNMGGNSPSWQGVWDYYQQDMSRQACLPRVHWIAVDTNNKDYDDFNPIFPDSELRRMRLGLTTCLLDDGYFSFSEGSGGYMQGVGDNQFWWFPEYEVDLGFPEGEPEQNPDGSWMRKFSNALVVVNPTDRQVSINLGTDCKDVTSGVESSRFLIPPGDGRILLTIDKG